MTKPESPNQTRTEVCTLRNLLSPVAALNPENKAKRKKPKKQHHCECKVVWSTRVKCDREVQQPDSRGHNTQNHQYAHATPANSVRSGFPVLLRRKESL